MGIPNLAITLAAWFAWNVIIFRIDKDQSDDQGKPFSLWQYTLQSYDNWLASLAMVPIILWLGYKGLGIPGAFVGVNVQQLSWSDFYYLCAGIATEAVIFAIKKYKASIK